METQKLLTFEPSEPKSNCNFCQSEFFINELRENLSGESLCSNCLNSYCFECSDCSCWEKKALGVKLHNGNMVCDVCKNEKYFLCYACEEFELNEDTAEVDGHVYCSGCRDSELSFCSDCENYCLSDHTISIGDNVVCDDCRRENYFECRHCGENFANDSSHTFDNDDSIDYCYDCYIDQAVECHACGSNVRNGDARYNDSQDWYTCNDCRKQALTEIKSTTFVKTDGIKRRFGVEIECFRESGENSPETKGFECGEDGSIVCDDEYRAEEHRTSILQGDAGMEVIEKHCKKLQASTYDVNKSCGLHVHIDCTDLKHSQLLNILSFIRVFDEVIFALMPKSRRVNHYCQRISVEKIVMQKLFKYKTEGEEVLKQRFNNSFEGLERYRGFNLQAYYEHGTVEFRYHSGTINEEKIKHWIITCLSIVEKMKDQEFRLANRAVVASKQNLKRFLDILSLPKDTQEYWKERFKKFYVEPKEAKAKLKADVEKALDLIIIDRDSGNNVNSRFIRDLSSTLRATGIMPEGTAFFSYETIELALRNCLVKLGA